MLTHEPLVIRNGGRSDAVSGRARGARHESRGALVFAAALLTLVVAGAAASSLLPQLDPLRADFAAALQPPGPGHWFGTDATGRDVFARTLAGGLSSLIVAALTLAVGLVVGSALGIAAGYFGRAVDEIVGTLTDLMLALPGLILIMVIVSLVGSDYWTVGLLIGVLTIPVFARIARSATLAVRDREFVHAARLLGASRTRIMTREIARTVLPSVLAYSFTAITAAIVAEGSLSFLGYGLQPPTPSWGGLIAEGRTHLASAPWIMLAPAVTMCATVLAVNILGERFARKDD